MITKSQEISDRLTRDGVTPFLPAEPIRNTLARKWADHFVICPLCRTEQYKARWEEHSELLHWPCPNGCGIAMPKIGVHMRHCERGGSFFAVESEIARLEAEIEEAQRTATSAKEVVESLKELGISLDEIESHATELLALLHDRHPDLWEWTERLRAQVRTIDDLLSRV